MTSKVGLFQSGTRYSGRRYSICLLWILWILITVSTTVEPCLAQTILSDDARARGREILSLYQQGRYADAIPKAKDLLARYEPEIIGTTDPNGAALLVILARLFTLGGDYAAARPLYERALKIREQALGPNHPDVAASLNGLAALLGMTGDYAAARSLFEQVLRIREQALGPNHPGLAADLNNLAEARMLTGDYAVARPLRERALKIQEQALGPNHPDVAVSLSDVAYLLYLTGDYAAARPLYERALKIREQALGPNHPSVASDVKQLADLLLIIGDYSGARPLHQRALKIREQALGPNHPDVAVSLSDVAYLLYLTGDYAAARPLYERALRIREQALGPNHPSVASSLDGLANLLQSAGDYAAARPLYERALKIREQALGPNHPSVASSLSRLAIFEWQIGRPEDAASKLIRAVEIARLHTSHGLVGLSNRQKLEFIQSTAYPAYNILSLPAEIVSGTNGYYAVLDRKNLLFRAAAGERTLTEANQSPQLAALLQDYTSARRQLVTVAISVPDEKDLPGYQERFANLSMRLESLEASLSRASADFRQTKAGLTTGPSEVCAVVPPDAALVDLFWYSQFVLAPTPGAIPSLVPAYVAFVLRGGDCATPIRVDLGPAGPIDEMARRFRAALSRDTIEPATRTLRAQYRQTLAKRLAAKLFPPALRAAIAGRPRLLIAPDGTLALVPFAILPGEDGHEFLLETRTISYLPSGRDLLQTRETTAAASALLAVGAPAFDRAPVQVAQAATVRAGCGGPDETFASLPGTAAELRSIATAYQKAHPNQPVTILEGAQASKAAFLDQAPKARILHLATHAYFAGEECTPAGLAPGPFQTLGETPAFLGHNPLLLAGIAFAGANSPEKADGILTALEITALDLRNTDLVVLSACDTGLGTLARGQELLGLRWAFAYAGAKHQVTSLWTVPDAETAILMTRFYTALWQQGFPVPDALRAAQLEMLKAARARGESSPHSWGAFVATGRPE